MIFTCDAKACNVLLSVEARANSDVTLGPRSISESLEMASTTQASNITAAMLLPRIFAPVRASIATSSAFIAPSTRVLDVLRNANGSMAPAPILSFVRHSAHQAQGRANGAKDGPGKRLGAKKSGGALTVPLSV